MRIDLSYEPQATLESERSTIGPAAAGSSSRNAAPGESLGQDQDQAQLSGAYVEVQTLAAQASQLPEVREDRVQTLRQAVEGGQYQARPSQVAGALVAHLIAARAA